MLDLDNVLTLTHKEIRDAQRNRWFLLYALVFTILALALAWLSMAGLGGYGLAGFGRTGASLINLVLLIVPLMGLTLGAMSLAGERERGTLLYLLAQPINYLELLLGKFLGLGLGLFTTLLIGFGLSGLLLAWRSGTADAQAYLRLVLLALLLGLVSLSLGLLISAGSARSATAVGLALFVWLALVFLGDLGLMGTALVLNLDVNQLFAAALLNPLQVFKMAAILNFRSSLEVLGPAGIYAVRTYGDALHPILISILIAWTLLPLTLSYFIFRRRGALS